MIKILVIYNQLTWSFTSGPSRWKRPSKFRKVRKWTIKNICQGLAEVPIWAKYIILHLESMERPDTREDCHKILNDLSLSYTKEQWIIYSQGDTWRGTWFSPREVTLPSLVEGYKTKGDKGPPCLKPNLGRIIHMLKDFSAVKLTDLDILLTSY